MSHGYPLTALGASLLVVGMLICSHVVEKSTVEETWDINPPPTDLEDTLGHRILWLQRGDTSMTRDSPPFVSLDTALEILS